MDKKTKEKVERIRSELEPLFIKAEKEGLWFWCAYVDIIIDPENLKLAQSEGHYLWGAVNWELVNPLNMRESLLKRATQLRREVDRIADRLWQIKHGK
jgi:hypothetical protein